MSLLLAMLALLVCGPTMIDLEDVWVAESSDMDWVEEFLSQFPIMEHPRKIASYPGALAFVVPGKLGVIVIVPVKHLGMAEMHVAIAPEGRGRVGIRAGRAAVGLCKERGLWLYGETPLEHKSARRYAAICGGERIGDFEDKEVRVWAAGF